MRPFAYVIGLSVANELSAIPGVLIFLALTEYFVPLSPGSFLTIFFSLVMVWACFSIIGFMISTRARDLKDLWTWSPIITMLISMLPPVFYPLELLPGWLRWVAYLVPSAVASRLIQGSLGAVTLGLGGPALLWSVLLLHVVLDSLLLSRMFRWRG